MLILKASKRKEIDLYCIIGEERETKAQRKKAETGQAQSGPDRVLLQRERPEKLQKTQAGKDKDSGKEGSGGEFGEARPLGASPKPKD